MLEKKYKYMIAGAMVLIIAIIIAAVSFLLGGGTKPSLSDLSPSNEDRAVMDVSGEKQMITEELEVSYMNTVFRYIEKGDGSGLDSYYKNIGEHYRLDPENPDFEGFQIDYGWLSEVLRGELTLIMNKDGNIKDALYYPESMLYAYLNLPVSRKIDCVINQASKIMPKGFAIEGLQEITDIPMDEYLDFLHKVSDISEPDYIEAKTYSFTIDGLPATLTLVRDIEKNTWSVYSLDCPEATAILSVSDLLKVKSSYDITHRDFDIDSYYQIYR